MSSFLSAFNSLYSRVGGNSTEQPVCETSIPTDVFHFFLLIPSVLMMLLLAFTMSRKQMGLGCLWGRPGAVFPMDILGKSHRFSYAAAWGAIAFLAADMVFGSTIIVNLEGPPYVTVFNKVLSMVVIGVAYIPMFSSLALQSVAGYLVGTAYAWMLLGINIYRLTECDFTYQARLILVLRDIPLLLCLGYLSISLPVRTVISLRKRSVRVISSSERVTFLNMSKEIDQSPEAVHVKKLFKPVLPPQPPPEGICANIGGIVNGLIKDLIYKNKKNFRYSSRILSVMLMGIMLIYKVTLELFVVVLSILKLVTNGFDATLDAIGRDPWPGEEQWITDTRTGIIFIDFLIQNVRICFIVALTLTLVLGILTVLHMLSSYRTNLQDLYKGDNTHIPHRDSISNPTLLVGSMRYAGYQVAYIAWGYALHFLILFIVCFALCVLITILMWGFTDWLVQLLAASWPALVMTIILMLVQKLSAKFAFLQDRGNVLAMNNRRVLFTFSYFMFFYNIFIGFLSCILRIIKSIVIGAIFLPRLDNSTLPRRFQMMDPGFMAYCGFIHVESSHTHPVLVMFLRILLLGQKTKKVKQEDEDNEKDTKLDMNGRNSNNSLSPMKKKRTVNIKARNRWLIAYTLTTNPALRAHRKSYIAAMKEMQQRIARFYNLNKTTMGQFVKGMNSAFAPMGSGAEIGGIEGAMNHAQANWSQAIGMNNFLHRLKRDMEMHQGMFAMDTGEGMSHTNQPFTGTEDKNGHLGEEHDGTNVFVKNPQNRWKMATFNALTNKGKDTEAIETETNYL